MRQNVVARNEQLVYAFVDVNIVSGNDIFDIRFFMLSPSCTKRSSVRNMITLRFFRGFWCNFRLESGKMREQRSHVCFIALTFDGSLGRCLNTRPQDLVVSCSNSFLGTHQMLMHEKSCMIPIFELHVWKTCKWDCQNSLERDCFRKVIRWNEYIVFGSYSVLYKW